jgi:hypothetical protein
MTFKTLKRFRDIHTREIYAKGAILELSQERADEMNRSPNAPLVEAVAADSEVKSDDSGASYKRKKNALDITWDDENEDAKLSGIIERGISYLNSVAGSSRDYSVNAKPLELLIEYCMYVRSNALSDFQKNYLAELLTLQISSAAEVQNGEENSNPIP